MGSKRCWMRALEHRGGNISAECGSSSSPAPVGAALRDKSAWRLARREGIVRRLVGWQRAGVALALTILSAACAGAGAGSTGGGRDVRAVAHEYFVAVAAGDGRRACALLSNKGLEDGGYSSRARCARDYSRAPRQPVPRIVRVVLKGPRTAYVTVEIGHGRYGETNTIKLARYGRRWLIDVG